MADLVKSADLHLHTHFSDGTFSPEEVVSRGVAAGLAVLALTDHDTLEGCARMASASALAGVEFVPGAELTADAEGKEVHVLGYWLDAGHGRLRSELARFQGVRQRRIEEMVGALRRAGVSLDLDAVRAVANCSSPGRPHVARALVAAGHASDYDDAFDKYLKKGRAGWVPKARMTVDEAVGLIHEAGGVAVLAHPGLYRDDGMVGRVLGRGLDGIECWHTRHSAADAARYEEMARRMGLVATGGSDCHGMAKLEPLIGRVRLPYERVEELRARRR